MCNVLARMPKDKVRRVESEVQVWGMAYIAILGHALHTLPSSLISFDRIDSKLEKVIAYFNKEEYVGGLDTQFSLLGWKQPKRACSGTDNERAAYPKGEESGSIPSLYYTGEPRDDKTPTSLLEGFCAVKGKAFS